MGGWGQATSVEDGRAAARVDPGLRSGDLLEVCVEGFRCCKRFRGCQEAEEGSPSAFGAQQDAEVARWGNFP
jgi:hypothetical protein